MTEPLTSGSGIIGVDHEQAERTARIWCANAWLPPWPNAEQGVFRNIANGYLDLRSDVTYLRELADELANRLVEVWHDTGDEETREAHEFMGMTWDEYKAWAERSGVWSA